MSIALRSSTTARGWKAGVDVQIPSTTQVGDLVVAYFAYNRSSTITPPTGWTEFADLNDTNNAFLYGAYRIAEAGDAGTTATWTVEAGGTKWASICLTYSGVNTQVPFDVSAATAVGPTTGSPTSDAPTAPSLTSVTDETVSVVAFSTYSSDTETLPTPTGYGDALRQSSQTATPQSWLATFDADVADANTATGDISTTLVNPERWCAAHILLRPRITGSATVHYLITDEGLAPLTVTVV